MSDTMKALADMLKKAQGVVDEETGRAIDIGGEAVRVRREHDVLCSLLRECYNSGGLSPGLMRRVGEALGGMDG